jgi:hypothetical protein
MDITELLTQSFNADELQGQLSDPEQRLLLEQCLAKIALDLETIKATLEFACQRGVIAEHTRLLTMQAKEAIERLIDRLEQATL